MICYTTNMKEYVNVISFEYFLHYNFCLKLMHFLNFALSPLTIKRSRSTRNENNVKSLAVNSGKFLANRILGEIVDDDTTRYEDSRRGMFRYDLL